MGSRGKSLFLLVNVLLVLLAVLTISVDTQQAFALRVDPPSSVITSTTHEVEIRISAVEDLWIVRFRLSFNNGTDFLEVSIEGVELGDLFIGKEADLSTGRYEISGVSYLEVLIEMPGNETITSTEEKTLASVTFDLLDNAMPQMASELNLEWADATFFTGGEPPYEYIDSESGITLESGTVTMGYLETILTLNDATTVIEEPAILYSTLRDGNGNPITNQNITYNVDSTKIGSSLTDELGISSIQYTPPEVGTYDITAEFLGNLPGGKFAGSSDVATLTVEKQDTTLTLNVQSSIEIGEMVDIVATLRKDGTPLDAANIVFYINSTQQGSEITNSSGIAQISFTFVVPGIYEIEAEYSGTANYAPSNDSLARMVAVEKTSLELTVNPAFTKVDQTISLVVVLKDDRNHGMSNSTIEYFIDQNWIGSVNTDANGFASMNFTPNEASPSEGWMVEAIFRGDSSYSSSVDSAMIVVNKLSASLVHSVYPEVLTVDQTLIVTATLTDENSAPISQARVDYYIFSKSKWTKIDDVVTDVDGIALLYYNPAMAEAALLKVNYTGSSRCLPASSEATIITIAKLATTISLTVPSSAEVGETIMIFAVLRDQNLKTIPDTKVEFHLITNSTKIALGSSQTNLDGIASLPYKPTAGGTLRIAATYAENEKHLASSDEASIEVAEVVWELIRWDSLMWGMILGVAIISVSVIVVYVVVRLRGRRFMSRMRGRNYRAHAFF